MNSLIKIVFLLLSLFSFSLSSVAAIIEVGTGKSNVHIRSALEKASSGDTILVYKGTYREGNISIDKPITLLGVDFPILDGELKVEIISIKSSNVTISGFMIINCSRNTLSDPAAIKTYHANHIKILNNKFRNNYFGIYLQYAQNCLVKENQILSSQSEEYLSGNGIHCWKSDSLQIIGNRIEGHRDGIYFEFVTASIIWRNIAHYNLRYGLHFMFSHNNAYITNYFKANGAGVAVMFTKKVVMINNTFEASWGDAAYGVLFKELTDCYLAGNKFLRNTTGIFFDGSNRITSDHNLFKGNGWGMRMQANCMDNKVMRNNFVGNTFDVATNGQLTLNKFSENYWDKYKGYDLNKDKIGDVPFHPLSLFSVIVEKNAPAMLLYQSIMITLIDQSEKILPSLTPENFIDSTPKMVPYVI